MLPVYSRVVFVAALALLTFLSLIPSDAVPKVFSFWDKAQHALGFAVVSWCGFLAYTITTAQTFRNIIIVALALIAHGGLIEVMQATLTTTRLGDPWDWLADIVGVVVALGLYRLYWLYWKFK